MLTNDQIIQLAEEARKSDIYWQDTGGEMHLITQVSVDPVDVEGDGFPVPVAYLKMGYIDLENVEAASLFATRQLFES